MKESTQNSGQEQKRKANVFMRRHKMTCGQKYYSRTFVELSSDNTHDLLERREIDFGPLGLSPRADLVMSNLNVQTKVFAP